MIVMCVCVTKEPLLLVINLKENPFTCKRQFHLRVGILRTAKLCQSGMFTLKYTLAL